MKTILKSMSRRVRLLVAVALAAVAVVVGVLVVYAEPVPRRFAYQGVLTDDAGNPLSGSYAITLRVFAGETGGTALCAETEAVTVTNGLFRLIIGDGGCVVDPAWFARTTPAYLEMAVGAATLSPRLALLPVASAYQAEHAEHAERADRLIVRYGTREISVGAVYCGSTSAILGNIGGYPAAKALCETTCGAPAAHLCTAEEVARSLQLGITVPPGRYTSVLKNSYVLVVSGTTYSTLITDCTGWTSNGAGNSSPGLSGSAPDTGSCNVAQPMLCCL